MVIVITKAITVENNYITKLSWNYNSLNYYYLGQVQEKSLQAQGAPSVWTVPLGPDMKHMKCETIRQQYYDSREANIMY